MSLPQAAFAILGCDVRRMLRDRFLVGTSVFVLGLSFGLRWAIPALDAWLAAEHQVALAPYLPLILTYFVAINTASLVGVVGGFLLLETRQARVLQALAVTPTPPLAHVATLAATLCATAVALVVAQATLIGLGPSTAAACGAGLLAGPAGLCLALITATAAKNTVEAFAVLKLVSLLGVASAASWFVPQPWQWLAAVLPPFWPCKLWWLALAGEPWAWTLAPGALCSAAWIAGLAPRYRPG